MTAMTETRHPAGIPIGGQFAPTAKKESSVALGGVRWVPDLDAGFEADARFPQPQANDLESVAAAVDAVQAGANTADAVGEALGMSPREGAYYANAAGYLGLITVAPTDDTVTTFELTELGQDLAASDPAGRVEILRQTVAATPGVHAYAEGGDAAVIDMLTRENLSDVTADRRASTIRSWYHALADNTEFTGLVEQQAASTRERAVAAAAHADEARRARVSAAAPKMLAVCTHCFMTISVNGTCGC